MKKGLIALIAVVVLLVIWGFSTYNGLVQQSEVVDSQWAQVETQYQRRLDVIPNLVNTVKGNTAQEKEVFTALAEARTRYGSAGSVDEKVAAASQVESALSRLLVISESYPELRSSEAFQNLMASVEGTENRISVERGRFNEVVRDYNTRIKTFPRNVFAGILGFHARNYFQSAEGSEAAPTVSF
jgi:LemA protein